MKKQTDDAPMLLIAGAAPASINAARLAIIEILKAPYADQDTKRAALASLGSLCAPSHITISQSTFSKG